jgi:hypothetical protein
LHTRDIPGSAARSAITNPISVMITVSPGRYTVLPNMKYRQELGGAAKGNRNYELLLAIATMLACIKKIVQ